MTTIKKNPVLYSEFRGDVEYHLFVQKMFPGTQILCAPYQIIRALLPKETNKYISLEIVDWKEHSSFDLLPPTVQKLETYCYEFPLVNCTCPQLIHLCLIRVTDEHLIALQRSLSNYPVLKSIILYVTNDVRIRPKALIDCVNTLYNFNPFMRVCINYGKTQALNEIDFIRNQINNKVVHAYHITYSADEIPYNSGKNPFYFKFFNNFKYTQMIPIPKIQPTTYLEHPTTTHNTLFLKLCNITDLSSNFTEANFTWITTLTKITMEKRVFNISLPTSMKEVVITEDFLYNYYNLNNIDFECKISNLSELNITRFQTLKFNQHVDLPTTLRELNIEQCVVPLTCPPTLTQLRIGELHDKVQFNTNLKELFINELQKDMILPSSLEYLYTFNVKRKLDIPLLSLEIEQLKKLDCLKLPTSLTNLIVHSATSFSLTHLSNLQRLTVEINIPNAKPDLNKYIGSDSLQTILIYLHGNLSKERGVVVVDDFTKHFKHVNDCIIETDFLPKSERKILKSFK
ncbi:Uncharacterized protein QTN25_008188 [Entamoeba marina]